MRILVGIMILTSLGWGASTEWKDSVRLDTLFSVPSGDTLKILGATHIQANSGASLRIDGILVMAGEGTSRISWTGGEGISVRSGGSAFLSGLDLSETSQGLSIRGGEATVWDSKFTASLGHAAATLVDGDLVMARTELAGSSPVLVADRGRLDLEDVVLRSDTLWRINPGVQTRFQDVEVFGKVRFGNPIFQPTHLPPDDDNNWRADWVLSPHFGVRDTRTQYQRVSGSLPIALSLSLGSRFVARLFSGWKSGWFDSKPVFNDRDQTLGQIQVRVLDFLEVGIEGGYGGSALSWNPERTELATGLLDRGMDLDEPFTSPGPVAGANFRIFGQFDTTLFAEFGVGLQWRGSSRSIDLGDLGTAWLTLTRDRNRNRSSLLLRTVYCLPDQASGAKGVPHWQWTTTFQHRQTHPVWEWGGSIDFEGREAGLLAQSNRVDVLWGGDHFRAGPSLGLLVAKRRDFWSSAVGPGIGVKIQPAPSWAIESQGWLRQHRDPTEEVWLGGDIELKISGGF